MIPALLDKMGFVRAADIQQIADNTGAHSFRLCHVNGIWQVFSSFFGGKVGSFVCFPGPNHESCACADIVAPLKSKRWVFTPNKIIQPIAVKIRWNSSEEIAPSVKLQNAVCNVRVDMVPRKRKLSCRTMPM